jgi:hypothetical protein
MRDEANMIDRKPLNSPSLSRRLAPGLAAGKLSLVLCAGLATTVLLPVSAQAALGAPYASIQADQTELHASLKVTPRATYEVHELTLPSGTLVREYVTTSGVVFAVAWNGPSKPNLSQLLGPYFADLNAAAQTSRGGHNHLDLTRSDLVIQAGGHMRAFSGRAYLVAAIPAGVSGDELR